MLRTVEISEIDMCTRTGSLASTFVRAPAETKHGVSNFDPDTALEWIKDCQSFHTECPHHNHYQLPTRVLDVSNYKSNNVRLLVTSGSDHQPYAALSYCWGTSKPLMTTSSSLNSRQEGIDITAMPKTYQDAIWVAGTLDIKYLWIDALCIVQDSGDDKIAELSRMRLYFENANIVIAASSAINADDGFLRFHTCQDTPRAATTNPHDSGIPQTANVPFYSPRGEKGTILLDASPEIYQANREPINQRAWTLEERLLCPRVLVFPSTGGFFLQCNREERHNDTIHFGTSSARSRLFSLSEAMWGQQGTEFKDVHKSWLMHIKDYSERNLTNAWDKPIAIAGVAEAYHHRFQSELGDYLAGHWSKYLLESLFWRVPLWEQKPAPTPARPPSWSWISVDSLIQIEPTVFYPQPYNNLAEIQDVAVTKVTERLPFGAVQTGSLSVKGPIGKAVWTLSERRVSLETVHGQPLDRVGTYMDTVENYPSQPTTVFVLPLRRACRNPVLLGLLLQPVASSDHSLFRRIGCFEFGPADWFLETYTEEKLVRII